MQKLVHLPTIVIAAAALGGCQGDPTWPNSFGPHWPSMDDAVRVEHSKKPNIVDNTPLSAESLATNVKNELEIGDGISPFTYTEAGYNFVYRNCSNYFDYLILWQNEVGFVNDAVVSGGTATSAILGLVKASTAAVSSVAAGTGFVSAALTSYNTRALMTPYPNETKTLILNSLDVWRKSYPPESVTDPAQAKANVQGFAEICTYSGISRAAKQALSAFKPAPTNQTSSIFSYWDAEIAVTLGLATTLTDNELAAMYYYLKNIATLSSTQQSAILATLSSDLQKILTDKSTTSMDKKNVALQVLQQLELSNADFAKAVSSMGPVIDSDNASVAAGKAGGQPPAKTILSPAGKGVAATPKDIATAKPSVSTANDLTKAIINAQKSTQLISKTRLIGHLDFSVSPPQQNIPAVQPPLPQQ